MAETRERSSISGFQLWALLIAWGLVLTPVVGATGWVAYRHYFGHDAASSTPLPQPDGGAESEDGGDADPASMPGRGEPEPVIEASPEPRLAWAGAIGGLLEEPDEAAPKQAPEQQAPVAEPEADLQQTAAQEPSPPAELREEPAPDTAAGTEERTPAPEPSPAAKPGPVAQTEPQAEEAGALDPATLAQSPSVPAAPRAEPQAPPQNSPETAAAAAPDAEREPGEPIRMTQPATTGSRGSEDVSVGLEASTLRTGDAPQIAGTEDEEHAGIAILDNEPPADALGGQVADGASPAALPLTRQPSTAEAGSEEAAPPWQRHSEAAATGTDRPRIAVVMTGLGLSAASTEAAIKQLPPTVTLSFTPYSRRLNDWIALARANKHEVMIDLPMEPATFPDDDPGPYALLTVLSEPENQKRLDWLLGRGKAFVGLAAVMGSRFSASEPHMLPLLRTLKEKGLLYLDNRSSGQGVSEVLARDLDLRYVAVDRMLDSDQASRIAINGRLSELERLAVENGFSVAIGQPYPVTIERIRDWSRDLAGRGYALVPITALAGAERRQQVSAGQ